MISGPHHGLRSSTPVSFRAALASRRELPCHFNHRLEPNVTSFLRTYVVVWTQRQLMLFMYICLLHFVISENSICTDVAGGDLEHVIIHACSGWKSFWTTAVTVIIKQKFFEVCCIFQKRRFILFSDYISIDIVLIFQYKRPVQMQHKEQLYLGRFLASPLTNSWRLCSSKFRLGHLYGRVPNVWQEKANRKDFSSKEAKMSCSLCSLDCFSYPSIK